MQVELDNIYESTTQNRNLKAKFLNCMFSGAQNGSFVIVRGDTAHFDKCEFTGGRLPTARRAPFLPLSLLAGTSKRILATDTAIVFQGDARLPMMRTLDILNSRFYHGTRSNHNVNGAAGASAVRICCEFCETDAGFFSRRWVRRNRPTGICEVDC